MAFVQDALCHFQFYRVVLFLFFTAASDSLMCPSIPIHAFRFDLCRSYHKQNKLSDRSHFFQISLLSLIEVKLPFSWFLALSECTRLETLF